MPITNDQREKAAHYIQYELRRAARPAAYLKRTDLGLFTHVDPNDKGLKEFFQGLLSIIPGHMARDGYRGWTGGQRDNHFFFYREDANDLDAVVASMPISLQEEGLVNKLVQSIRERDGIPDFNLRPIDNCFVGFASGNRSALWGSLEKLANGHLQTYMEERGYPGWTVEQRTCFFIVHRSDIVVDYASVAQTYEEQFLLPLDGSTSQRQGPGASDARADPWLAKIISPIPKDPAEKGK